MSRVTGFVTASALNVRPEPSTVRPPVGRLPRGAELEILEQHGGWYRIRAGAAEGWVYGDYVVLHRGAPLGSFLHESEALRAVPLEPASVERVEVGAAAGAVASRVARSWNRYGGLLAALSEAVAIRAAAAVAVLCVESGGSAFQDGRMVIRFENHVFHREWGRANPETFERHFSFDPHRRWLGHRFRADEHAAYAPFHGSQAGEWRVFGFARALDETAAMRSISMGAPQIMGFNHAAIGYDSVRAMFYNFTADARYQILGMFDFIRGRGASSAMLQALQRGDYEQFASRYNGPGQAAVYGERIRAHLRAFELLRPPS